MKVDLLMLPDGGYCLSVVKHETGRELELVYPADHNWWPTPYFVARTDGGRDAGIVSNPRGLASLLQWVTSWCELPSVGLEIAKK